jgi:hypothetical protein
VREETRNALKHTPGTIVPKGQSLGSWRERATGGEVDFPNPISRGHERISIARWARADPDRTYLILSFQHLDKTLAGRTGEEVERIRGQQRAARGATPIKPHLSEEASLLKAAQAELQRRYQEACDRGDEPGMGEISAALETKAQELSRAAFPDYMRGWDLSRAIRHPPATFILDWDTGY